MRRLLLLLTAALLSVAATGSGQAGSVLVPSEVKLFPRNDGNGCPGDPFLAVTPGTGEPGCGYVAGAPFRELTHAGAPVTSNLRSYQMRGSFTQALDATRDVTGGNRVVATSQTGRRAVGQIRVDVTLIGLQGRTELVLGSDSTETVVNPTNSAEVDLPFRIDVPDELDTTQLTGLRLEVDIRGWHVLTGYHRLNGQSSFTLPTHVVQDDES